MDSPTMLAKMAGIAPRQRGAAPVTMSERLGAAIYNARPIYWKHEPSEAVSRWQFISDGMRKFYVEWADELLRNFDGLGLEMIDHGREEIADKTAMGRKADD